MRRYLLALAVMLPLAAQAAMSPVMQQASDVVGKAAPQAAALEALLADEPRFATKPVQAWLKAHPKPRNTDAMLLAVRDALRPDGEALADFDAAVNRMLIERMLPVIAEGLDSGWITPGPWEEEAARLEVNAMRWQVEQFVIPALVTDLDAVAGTHEGALLYVAIGCGRGAKDIATKEAIEKTYPKLEVKLYCLDPYQQARAHPFVQAGGLLDTQKLREKETLLQRARARMDTPDAPAIVVGHYAFHHLDMNYAQFKKHVAGSDAIYLFESVPPDTDYDRMHGRMRWLVRDLLVNYGFDQLHGGDWVAQALKAPKDGIFLAYYLTDRTLREQAKSARLVHIPRTPSALIIDRAR